MKKYIIMFFAFSLYSCVVPVSIGNRSVADNENKTSNDSNTVYTQNGKTMVAINYILPQRAGQFEMLTKTVIMPAMKREDGEVFKSLKFLVPEEQNEDGNLTYMFIADPYLEEKIMIFLKYLYPNMEEQELKNILIVGLVVLLMSKKSFLLDDKNISF